MSKVSKIYYVNVKTMREAGIHDVFSSPAEVLGQATHKKKPLNPILLTQSKYKILKFNDIYQTDFYHASPEILTKYNQLSILDVVDSISRKPILCNLYFINSEWYASNLYNNNYFSKGRFVE